MEKFTLELPGGLHEGDEAPERAAFRKLGEETGLHAISAPHSLGCLTLDHGRFENRLWGYKVRVQETDAPGWQPEPGLERLLVSCAQLCEWILGGQFDNAPQIALIGWL